MQNTPLDVLRSRSESVDRKNKGGVHECPPPPPDIFKTKGEQGVSVDRSDMCVVYCEREQGVSVGKRNMFWVQNYTPFSYVRGIL